jgi:hypothetical protein
MRQVHNPQPTTHNSQFAILLLLLITAALYARALNFGFMWDDPLWLSRLLDKPIGALVKPMSDYQFYRPGTLLYHRLFMTRDNTFTAPLLHAAQIGWHLLNVALTYALSRRLGLTSWAATAVAGLTALYPFSHQAVAWAMSHQLLPTVLQNGAWLTYIAARRHSRLTLKNKNVAAISQSRMHTALRRNPQLRGCFQTITNHLPAALSLMLFLAALAVHESTAALAPVPLLIEWVLRRRHTDKDAQNRHGIPVLALTYLLIAGGYGLFWLGLPRQSDYVALAFDESVILYFVQGFIYPLLGRPMGYEPPQTWAPGTLWVLAGLTIGGLLVMARRSGQGRQALFGLAMALLGIAPSAIGLDYSYVRLGSRLLYHSSPGIAMLWVCALLPKPETRLLEKNPVSPRRLWRITGAVLLVLIALQSSLLLVGFQRLYTVGSAHVDELIRITPTEDAHLLFINFPDRYALKRPPYPLGYWGVTLAPVSVDLEAFPAVTTGRHFHTTSRSIPVVDFDARDTGPYLVDMRGEITPPDQLVQLAHQMDAVYLSRYFLDGSFALQWAGDVATAPPIPFCELANFGQTLCLQQAQVDLRPDELSLILTWLSLSTAQPHDTIFAHVGTPDQPPIAQNDDDAWLGILPLTVWQPGDVIHEQRIIPLPRDTPPGQYQVRVGVYNRITGQRLSATTPHGDPLPDDVIIIGHLTAPN